MDPLTEIRQEVKDIDHLFKSYFMEKEYDSNGQVPNLQKSNTSNYISVVNKPK